LIFPTKKAQLIITLKTDRWVYLNMARFHHLNFKTEKIPGGLSKTTPSEPQFKERRPYNF
jgi:hypothetical protein